MTDDNTVTCTNCRFYSDSLLVQISEEPRFWCLMRWHSVYPSDPGCEIHSERIWSKEAKP